MIKRPMSAFRPLDLFSYMKEKKLMKQKRETLLANLPPQPNAQGDLVKASEADPHGDN